MTTNTRNLDAKKVYNRDNKWDQTIAGSVMKIAGRASVLGNVINKMVREKYPDNFSAANKMAKELFKKCYDAIGAEDPHKDFNDLGL